MDHAQLVLALKTAVQTLADNLAKRDALNALKLEGKTLAEVTALVLQGTAANALMLEGKSYDEIVATLTGDGSLLAALQQQVDTFIARRDNPHEVTKEQVGLGLVENYAVATSEEAALGVANKYMTPALSKELITAAIDALVGTAPETLDTLQELAAALQNNPDIIQNLLDQIALKETPAGAQAKADAALAEAKAYTDSEAAETLTAAQAYNDEAIQAIVDECNRLAQEIEGAINLVGTANFTTGAARFGATTLDSVAISQWLFTFNSNEGLGKLQFTGGDISTYLNTKLQSIHFTVGDVLVTSGFNVTYTPDTNMTQVAFPLPAALESGIYEGIEITVTAKIAL